MISKKIEYILIPKIYQKGAAYIKLEGNDLLFLLIDDSIVYVDLEDIEIYHLVKNLFHKNVIKLNQTSEDINTMREVFDYDNCILIDTGILIRKDNLKKYTKT